MGWWVVGGEGGSGRLPLGVISALGLRCAFLPHLEFVAHLAGGVALMYAILVLTPIIVCGGVR